MAKVKVQRKSKGQMIQEVLRVCHLTFEICHLEFRSSSLFRMPETGIVNEENGKTVGAHLG